MPDLANSLVFGTRNPHKRRELEELLSPTISPRWKTFDIGEWPEPVPEFPEDRDSFRGNALQKAEGTSLHAACTAIADDSGLVVDALDGRPGIHSSRYAGDDATAEDNNRKLLEELEGVPRSERTARFVCVLALVATGERIGRSLVSRAGLPFDEIPEGRPTEEATLTRAGRRVYLWCRGTVEGRILEEPRGEGGFGYDPLFYVPELEATFGQADPADKQRISHRAEAAQTFNELFAPVDATT
ncbi:MAG: non-canonical purine NTP pyrophosphatase [Bradymonadaceae bacterium]